MRVVFFLILSITLRLATGYRAPCGGYCPGVMQGPATSAVSLLKESDIVWRDEFEGTSLNEDNWSYDTGRTGWGTGECTNYTSSTENVYVQDGMLHIAVKEHRDEHLHYKRFTSGRITTQKKMTFRYGTLVANVSWPDVVEGLSPKLWTMGANYEFVQWPACGEVDLL